MTTWTPSKEQWVALNLICDATGKSIDTVLDEAIEEYAKGYARTTKDDLPQMALDGEIDEYDYQDISKKKLGWW